MIGFQPRMGKTWDRLTAGLVSMDEETNVRLAAHLLIFNFNWESTLWSDREQRRSTVAWWNCSATVCSKRCLWWGARSCWGRHRRTASVERHQPTYSQPSARQRHRPSDSPPPAMTPRGTVATATTGETPATVATGDLERVDASCAWTLKTNTWVTWQVSVTDYVKFNRGSATQVNIKPVFENTVRILRFFSDFKKTW